MATSYSWAQTRERAAEGFGGSWPDAQLESEIIEHFRERPAFVVDAIADVTNAYQAGRIRSPWPFLRKRLAEAPTDVVVEDAGERERAIKRAQQWIRAAGLYCDREGEVLDELFGELGSLRAWSGDQRLRDELLALWQAVRPEGQEAAERLVTQIDALERATGSSRRTVHRRDSAGAFTAPVDDEWGTLG